VTEHYSQHSIDTTFYILSLWLCSINNCVSVWTLHDGYHQHLVENAARCIENFTAHSREHRVIPMCRQEGAAHVYCGPRMWGQGKLALMLSLSATQYGTAILR
jgi:hypothetical protein